jgi:hypothetical protein
MYLPWMGYFGFIEQADVFVFHDNIEFVRSSWQRRNQIKIPEDNGETEWLTVPIIKDQGQNINEVEIKNESEWQSDHWRKIKQAYSEEPVPYGSEHAPYFDEYADLIEPFFEREWNYLSELNTALITELSDALENTNTEFRYASEMDISGSKTERVIDILETLGADEYVNGPSGKDYLDVEQFSKAGITLYWHEFEHPEYDQPYGAFQSHMSVIDFLFNVGPRAPELLRAAEERSLERESGT